SSAPRTTRTASAPAERRLSVDPGRYHRSFQKTAPQAVPWTPDTLAVDGQRAPDQRRRGQDRRRRARRRAVHDADEDARRRGDDGPDRGTRERRLRGRPLRGAEDG